MRSRQVFQNLEIVDISTEGKGVGRVNNMVCFVDFAVPGDVVDVEITGKKKNYLEGRTTLFHKRSDKRTTPVCKHFGTCGGCKWQDLGYESQLFYKQKYVEDAITRLAKINTTILPIIPSRNIFSYRNKLEFTFSNRRWLTSMDQKPETWNKDQNGLGFHIPRLFDKILDIEQCHLQEDLSNSIRLEVKRYALEKDLAFFDIRKQEGFLRNLIIRNTANGQWMVVLVLFHEDKPEREGLLKHIKKKFPQVSSLHYVINPKRNDTISDLKTVTFSGNDFIEEEIEGLKFRISPKSFFQTNTTQAYELYKVARDFSELKGDETVYDLYTGTGTIANFMARGAKKVIGVEYISEAVEDAKINSQINNISNTGFFSGDIKDILNDDFIRSHGKPDIIITDPPRAGMHEDVVRKMLEISASRIVYVSCNPATQARDISILSEKYTLNKVQPVDMFPHTAHVESVAQLTRKGGGTAGF